MPETAGQHKHVRDAVDSLRDDFGDHAYLIFVSGLLLSTGDYEQIHRDSILDGPDDKKIDLFHIDRESGRAIVIQAYESQNWSNTAPPANKASDLNTASAWLLDADIDTIARPDIRAAAEELRDALGSGDIYELAFYFLHTNQPNANVQTEIDTVRESLINKLESWSQRASAPINGSVKELSIDDVVDLYESRHAAITITDSITLPIEHRPLEVEGEEWRGVSVTVRASDIVALVDQYGESLTSANIRDYLGRRSSSRNINRQIGVTAQDEPTNFWVYNNGLTFITRKFQSRRTSLECNGLAVTNGAQTLGSLSDMKDRSVLDDVRLPVRIIESNSPTLIEKIIRYNNTQNPIKPWELRVLDPVQVRLQEDFKNRLDIVYQFRRGGGRTSVQNVHLSKLAPWLASFNGDPIRAHRNSPELFENERTYRALFNENSDVHHLLVVYRIGEAVGETKNRYKILANSDEPNEADRQLYSYFRYGAFTTAVVYFASEVLLEILGAGQNAKKSIRLVPTYEDDRDSAINYLRRLVEFTIAPIPSELEGIDAYAALRTETSIGSLRDRIQVSVRQMRALREEVLESLVEGLSIT